MISAKGTFGRPDSDITMEMWTDLSLLSFYNDLSNPLMSDLYSVKHPYRYEATINLISLFHCLKSFQGHMLWRIR